MSIKLTYITPHPKLVNVIEKLWVFESSGRMPSNDMKLIVPNGMLKVVIPFTTGITGTYHDWSFHSKESAITLIGIADSPAIVDLDQDSPHGNIGIEFSPWGAYRVFSLRHSELKNRIHLLEDVLGKSARELQEEVTNEQSIQYKIDVVQKYFIKLLSKSKPDPILDYCLQQIKSSRGVVSVGHLESKTGFSSRWLYEKFIEKVGLSPKNLSSVQRFMQFYQEWAKNPGRSFYQEHVYDYFYDQAHFIREFKRFTGASPLKFVKSENEFGRIFYKD